MSTHSGKWAWAENVSQCSITHHQINAIFLLSDADFSHTSIHHSLFHHHLLKECPQSSIHPFSISASLCTQGSWVPLDSISQVSSGEGRMTPLRRQIFSSHSGFTASNRCFFFHPVFTIGNYLEWFSWYINYFVLCTISDLFFSTFQQHSYTYCKITETCSVVW